MSLSKEQALDRIAAQLGANEDWNSAADYLDSFVETINQVEDYDHRTGSIEPAALKYWRGIADSLGVEHDGPPAHEDIEALTAQVRDREGDWLTALDIIAEYAQKRVDDENDNR